MPLDASTDSIGRIALLEFIRKQGDKLFDRGNILLSWQDAAEQFFPARADFTVSRIWGEEMAGHLMSSMPVLACRDLANSFSAMLRPASEPWFWVRTMRPEKEDTGTRQWLDWMSELMRNAMYDRKTGFISATREVDFDFVTFGQGVLEHRMFYPKDGSTPHLHYTHHHLRDVAWKEGPTGRIDTIYCRRKEDALTLCRTFKNVHTRVREKITGTSNRDPYHQVNVWHVILPTEVYREMPGGKDFPQPYVAIWYDVDNNHEMECVGQWTKRYNIPRWARIHGCQYAYSPPVMAGLPDARLQQALSLTLLEAGEKSVNPPLIAVTDAIRGDVGMYAGAIIKVDADYDEKTGEVLRPIGVDKSGLTFGLEMIRDNKAQLQEAFFLNKLNMPPVGGPDMTAYEVGQRIQEHIRTVLPLFEPAEIEYNTDVCDDTFTLLSKHMSPAELQVPANIASGEVKFMFKSPLRDASDKAKAGQLLEMGQVLASVQGLDASTILMVDAHKATREVLQAVGPSKWLRSEKDVQAMLEQKARDEQAAKMMATMAAGAEVAKTTSEAAANAATAMPGLGLA
jgi:hypothetical protein